MKSLANKGRRIWHTGSWVLCKPQRPLLSITCFNEAFRNSQLPSDAWLQKVIFQMSLLRMKLYAMESNAYVTYYIGNVLAKLLIHELPLGWIWRGINACCSVIVNQFSLRRKTFPEGLKAGNQAGSKIPMGTVAQGVRETLLAPTQAQLGTQAPRKPHPVRALGTQPHHKAQTLSEQRAPCWWYSAAPPLPRLAGKTKPERRIEPPFPGVCSRWVNSKIVMRAKPELGNVCRIGGFMVSLLC